MIKLYKEAEPRVLVENSVNWTNVILSKISNGVEPTSSEKTRYRHKDIKSALEHETAGKCAYCESKLKHIHHGDVEHIYPKSLDPAKQFTWSNLTLACEICNQNKSNRDPTFEHIIDPYLIDPVHHICFIGSLAYPLGTIEGVSSISILDLNRIALLSMRNESLQRIMGIFDVLLRPGLPLPAKKAILQDLENNEISNSSQFSAVLKSAYDMMKTKLPKELFDEP